MQETKASRRVKEDIKRYTHNPIEAPRALALRANSKEKTKVATRRQIAAARRNIKKAQAAKRSKNPRRRRKRAKRRRRNAAAPVAKRRATRVTRAANDWPNDRRGHRRAAKKGWRRRKRKRARRRKGGRRRKNPIAAGTSSSRTINERVKVVKIPGATKVVTRQSNPRRRRRYKRRRNPASRKSGMLGGLMSNPAGPFTASSLRRFAVAAGGIGFGLVVAGALDRYVATRTPAASGARDGVHPWYGRDAAAAIARRPDAMRLGAQAAGAVGAMALAYWTRRGNILPFLLGGTAVGFGANLFKQLTDWWIMPAILSTEPTEQSLGNRLYPLEQAAVQDEIDGIFENWDQTLSLAEGQDETPIIQSPLASANPTAGAYALGKGGNGHPESGGISGSQFIKTGRLGKCTACNGEGGCWASCSDYTGYVTANCPGCPPNAMDRAMYTVQSGDNLESMLSMSQTDINMLNHLNGNIPPASYWQVGKQVTVPFNLGRYIDERGKTKAAAGLAGAEESVPPPITPPNGDNQEQSVHSILND